MGQRGRGLAGRFRRAVEAENDRELREQEEARRQQERAARARSNLFDELVAFAEETGFLRARLQNGALTLVHGPRELRFEPVGEADGVAVHWEGQDPEEAHRLYVEPQLEHAWVWARKRRMRPREDRELLWDRGLEELLVAGLGLPRPDLGAEPAGPVEAEDPSAETKGQGRDRDL